MSMTVNATNYQSSMLQNTRSASAEKHGQKDETTEVGKTQQSTVSASLDQTNMGKDGIAITEVSRQQGAEQSADSSATEKSQYEVEDLSEYTNTELKQMYYKGEITRQEYEDETGEVLE